MSETQETGSSGNPGKGINMAQYGISVEDSEGRELVQVGTGSLGLVGYALGDVKELLQGAGQEKFTVALREIHVADNRSEVITELTANGRTAFAVLKTEVTALRKQAREAAQAPELHAVQNATGE